MKKKRLLMLFALLPVLSLASCGQKPHTHEYDYENLTWNWTKLTEGGYSATATAKCKGCEETTLKDATVTSEVVSPSTCLEQGVISYTAKAIFEGTEYTDLKSDFLPLGNHTFGLTTYAWSTDYTECVATRECTLCHEKENEDGTVESQVITEATCEHEGVSNLKATFDASWAVTQETAETPIPKKPHEYGEDLNCKSCKKSMKVINELNDATEDDIKVTPTLSTLGQSAFDFSNSHTFVNYNFAQNGDFELIYSYKYTQKTSGGDSNYSIYLFNGRDEKGLVIQPNTNRTNAGQDVYIYRNSATQAGAAFKGDIKVKDLPTGRSEEGHYYFQFDSKLVADGKTDSNIMYIKGTLVDKATNEYNVVIKTGGSYAELHQLTTDYDHAAVEHDITLNVTLGANYFDSINNPCIRFSLSNAAAVHASDYAETYTSREIVYKDLEGKVYAKKGFTSEETIVAPVINKEGYKFIGWYDQHGNSTDEITSNGKYIVTPRFIKNVGENEIRQTLSDFNFVGKDTTKWVSDWTGESISEFGIKDATSETKSIEAVFKYRYQSSPSDYYPIFGFTYDGIDETGRVNTRIDLFNSRKTFRGYIYGNRTSLGNAGATGTRYEESNFQMFDNDVYLISIQIVKNDSNFAINLTIESLGTGASTKVSKDFTYNSSSIVDFSKSDYTKMAINATIYSPMVKDAY